MITSGIVWVEINLPMGQLIPQAIIAIIISTVKFIITRIQFDKKLAIPLKNKILENYG
jgi:hypothetical protein